LRKWPIADTLKILNRAMEAEMGNHVGYPKNSNAGDNSWNSRNGHTEKTVLTENQTVGLKYPATETELLNQS
jgi:transposase-like protein